MTMRSPAKLKKQRAAGARGRSEFAVPAPYVAHITVSEFQVSQLRRRRARAGQLTEQFKIVVIPVRMMWGFEHVV
jgi:hypothetical protein